MRHSQVATIPFSPSFDMPELDSRTRGYLPEYIKNLQTTVGGEWSPQRATTVIGNTVASFLSNVNSGVAPLSSA